MHKYLFTALILFASCNSAKKVLSNQKEFQKVGEAWAKQNPCANDTSIVFRPGRVDTLQLSAPVYDVNHSADSIAQALASKYQQRLQLCDAQVKEAYSEGYLKASSEWGSIKIPMPRHDTINNYIRDTRQEKIYESQIVDLNQQVVSEMNKADDYKSERNTAYIILLLIVMTTGTIAYFKFIK